MLISPDFHASWTNNIANIYLHKYSKMIQVQTLQHKLPGNYNNNNKQNNFYI